MKAHLSASALLMLCAAHGGLRAQGIVPAAKPPAAEAPLTTADLLPLPGDELDPTLAAAPAAAPAPAPVPATPADPDLPQPFDAASLGPVIQNSPFTPHRQHLGLPRAHRHGLCERQAGRDHL